MKSVLIAIAAIFVLSLLACSRHEVHPTLPASGDKAERIRDVPPGPEKMFPDYRPKTSPDRVVDYRPEISKQLSAFPKFSQENLPRLISEFQSWNERAKKDHGHFQQGNVILGAPPREYLPSDAELVAGYLGDGLKKLIKPRPGKSVQTSYLHFEFEHVDVMGSGRFFYCSAPIETKLVLPPVL